MSDSSPPFDADALLLPMAMALLAEQEKEEARKRQIAESSGPTSEPVPPLPARQQIVFIGDELVSDSWVKYRAEAPLTPTWIDQVRREYIDSADLLVRGHPLGFTSGWGRMHLPTLLGALPAGAEGGRRVFVVWFGPSDMMVDRKNRVVTSSYEYEAHVGAICTQLATIAPVILLTPLPARSTSSLSFVSYERALKYSQAATRLGFRLSGEGEGVEVVDLLLEAAKMGKSHSNFVGEEDGIHLSAEGHSLCAKILSSALTKLFGGRFAPKQKPVDYPIGFLPGRKPPNLPTVPPPLPPSKPRKKENFIVEDATDREVESLTYSPDSPTARIRPEVPGQIETILQQQVLQVDAVDDSADQRAQDTQAADEAQTKGPVENKQESEEQEKDARLPADQTAPVESSNAQPVEKASDSSDSKKPGDDDPVKVAAADQAAEPVQFEKAEGKSEADTEGEKVHPKADSKEGADGSGKANVEEPVNVPVRETGRSSNAAETPKAESKPVEPTPKEKKPEEESVPAPAKDMPKESPKTQTAASVKSAGAGVSPKASARSAKETPKGASARSAQKSVATPKGAAAAPAKKKK